MQGFGFHFIHALDGAFRIARQGAPISGVSERVRRRMLSDGAAGLAEGLISLSVGYERSHSFLPWRRGQGRKLIVRGLDELATGALALFAHAETGRHNAAAEERRKRAPFAFGLDLGAGPDMTAVFEVDAEDIKAARENTDDLLDAFARSAASSDRRFCRKLLDAALALRTTVVEDAEDPETDIPEPLAALFDALADRFPLPDPEDPFSEGAAERREDEAAGTTAEGKA